LAAVGVEVDRFRVQECFVEPVEFQADGFEPPFLLGSSLPSRGALQLPHVEHAVLDDAHVAGRLLQQCQFVYEGAFECSLADVDRRASARVVVVGIAAAPALRPAAGERGCGLIAGIVRGSCAPSGDGCADDAAVCEAFNQASARSCR
jgi:hypothetical protein